MSAFHLEDHVAMFPGQGSITSESARSWTHANSWSIANDISDATGLDVGALLLDSTDADIVRTDRAQLATFSLSMIGWHHYLEHHAPPRFVLGHSLGEVSALVAAGVMSLADGARLVVVRGGAMRDAALLQPGKMVALMGPSENAVENLADLADVWIANINGTGQIVVSGTESALDHLVANARALGWKRASSLTVGGAFHSPLMAPAQSALDAVLDEIHFRDMDYAIVANVDAQVRHGGDQWRELLSRQLTSPVQFLAMIEALPAHVTAAVELPPAGVLVGLTKRIRDFVSLSALDAPASP